MESGLFRKQIRPNGPVGSSPTPSAFVLLVEVTMPNKNSKKARRAAQGGGSAGKEEARGFRVVSVETGKPIYLPAHPEGISEKEAKRLAEGLGDKAKVVTVSLD
jgi:hypothetical protein